MFDACLYLENGHLFEGQGFGANRADRICGGEVVFNTGMTGYEEIFTDPSYAEQIIVMTYPHIGNTGINFEDHESSLLPLSGVVVREYVDHPSNWRSRTTLSQFLTEKGIPAISDVDTRELTRILRSEGAQRGVIFARTSKDPITQGKECLQKIASMEGLELVSQVSIKAPYEFEPGTGSENIVVYDYGVKRNILRSFKEHGLKVQVVPYNFPAEELGKWKPKCVVLSNGPGDPATVQEAVPQIQKIIGKIPLFAICMGHQLLGRALNAGTYKLKFGHHGVNHPVKDLLTGQILITSQNHGFCVNEKDLKIEDVTITHTSLNDGTLEGFGSKKMRFQSIQFHPEACPGPNDAKSLFRRFLSDITFPTFSGGKIS